MKTQAVVIFAALLLSLHLVTESYCFVPMPLSKPRIGKRDFEGKV